MAQIKAKGPLNLEESRTSLRGSAPLQWKMQRPEQALPNCACADAKRERASRQGYRSNDYSYLRGLSLLSQRMTKMTRVRITRNQKNSATDRVSPLPLKYEQLRTVASRKVGPDGPGGRA